jgi:hypothetical protein
MVAVGVVDAVVAVTDIVAAVIVADAVNVAPYVVAAVTSPGVNPTKL